MLDLDEQIYLLRALLRQLLIEKANTEEDEERCIKCTMCNCSPCMCPDDVEYKEPTTMQVPHEIEEELNAKILASKKQMHRIRADNLSDVVDKKIGNKASLFE